MQGYALSLPTPKLDSPSARGYPVCASPLFTCTVRGISRLAGGLGFPPESRPYPRLTSLMAQGSFRVAR